MVRSERAAKRQLSGSDKQQICGHLTATLGGGGFSRLEPFELEVQARAKEEAMKFASVAQIR